MPELQKQPQNNKWVKALGLFYAIVSELVACVGAGVGLGYLAWSKLGAPWWVVLILASSGLALGMYRLYLLSKKF